MEENILEEIENYIERMINCLKCGVSVLERRGYGNQKINDFNSGYIQMSGIFIPLKSIDYRILYDHYEIILLKSFINLIENTLKYQKSPLISFTFRTIQEIGIMKLDVFFANEVSQDEKDRIKLFALLTDFIAMDGPEFNEQFSKLYTHENHRLSSSEQQVFNNIISTQDQVVEKRLIKKARTNLGNTFENFHKKITPHPFLTKDHLKILGSWWSHLLHGNPFLINNAFDPKASWRDEYRFYAVALISCLSATRRIVNYSKDPSLISNSNSIDSEFNLQWNKLIVSWKEIERLQKN